MQIPPELVGTVLRGELYGQQADKTIPPQQLGGLLNAGIAKSIAQQKEQQIKLRNLVFDVHQYGEQPTAGLPYSERMTKLKEVLKHLPAETFHAPEEATTPEAARQLFEQIRSGKHPLTQEGIVIHPATGVPSKVKFMDEHDVHVREIFPGMGKYQGTAAGGFRYSHEPEGPIVGEVGTGLSDELRRDMWENQADYIGRVAKVQAQQKFPSGALRAPSLLSIHEDIPATAVQQATSDMGSARQRIRALRQSGTGQAIQHAGGALAALRQAKVESDRKNWPAKHDLVRQTVMAEPQNFTIDSETGGIAGLTHKLTGFKIHLPSTAVPTELRLLQ